MDEVYRVATGNTVGELADTVNAIIEEGYTPIGGIAVIYQTWKNERKGYDESETWMYQALVKTQAASE